MDDVTLILSAIEQGERSVAEERVPLVYEELRKLAGRDAPSKVAGYGTRARRMVLAGSSPSGGGMRTAFRFCLPRLSPLKEFLRE